MTRAERLTATLIHETQLRVDTRDRACQWFRIIRGYAQPLSLLQVWQLAWHRGRLSGLQGNAADYSLAIRMAQRRVPILTEHEWYGTRHTERRAA